MRQSKAAGRALGNARRVALTSLGAGLVVGAAAPLASAATVTETAPPPATAIASAAESASMTNVASVPLTSGVGAADAATVTPAVDAAAPAPAVETVPTVADAAAPANAPAVETVPMMADVSSTSANVADPTTTADNAAPTTSTAALNGTTAANWARLGHVKLYPLAGTGIDPLSNVVGTSLGGIPVSTVPVTSMVSDGLPVSDLPVVGGIFNAPQV